MGRIYASGTRRGNPGGGSGKCRQGRLPQADAAIVRRNGVVGPNRQGLAAQQVAHVQQQQLVLENAAGEHDRIELPLVAERCYRRTPVLARLHVEMLALFPLACGHVSAPPPRLAVAGENPARHSRTETDTLQCHRSSRQRFHPHGGLSFEGYAASESQQGRGRIEQPPDRRRREASHVFAHQLQRLLVTRGESERRWRSDRAGHRSAPEIRPRLAPDIAPRRRRREGWRAADALRARSPRARCRRKTLRPRCCHHRHSQCRRS